MNYTIKTTPQNESYEKLKELLKNGYTGKLFYNHDGEWDRDLCPISAKELPKLDQIIKFAIDNMYGFDAKDMPLSLWFSVERECEDDEDIFGDDLCTTVPEDRLGEDEDLIEELAKVLDTGEYKLILSDNKKVVYHTKDEFLNALPKVKETFFKSTTYDELRFEIYEKDDEEMDYDVNGDFDFDDAPICTIGWKE